jgi:hypothetical protein
MIAIVWVAVALAGDIGSLFPGASSRTFAVSAFTSHVVSSLCPTVRKHFATRDDLLIRWAVLSSPSAGSIMSHMIASSPWMSREERSRR